MKTTTASLLLVFITIQFIPIGSKPILIISKPGESTPAPVLSTCRDGQYIKVDCKIYIDCYKGGWRRQYCPSNTFWNDDAKKCDDIHNVPPCYKLLQEIKLKPGMRLVDEHSTSNSKLASKESNNEVRSNSRVFAEPYYYNSADQVGEENEYFDYETESEEEVERAVTPQTSDPEDEEDWESYVPPSFNTTQDNQNENDEFEPEDTPTSQPITEADNHVKRSPGDIITPETESKSYFDIPQNTIENRTSIQVRPIPAFYGQLCLLRGKQMECKNVTNTTRAKSEPSSANTTSINKQCLNYLEEPHTWTLRITIRINTEIFEKIERITRVVAYYFSFLIYFLVH